MPTKVKRPKLQTLAQVIAALEAFVPNNRTMRAQYRLNRMRALLKFVGNPQNSLRVVHIAGTSGKTSTTYFITAMLQAAGARTGMTISPHITSITERLQINGRPVSDRQFVRYVNEFLPLLEASNIQPTYFELLIALAYWVFAKEKVDYAVVETGLGGLLDGTNTCERPDKVCVITDIGFDHTEVLGGTLPEIACQKAGIIQPHNTVFVRHQSREIMHVFEEAAAANQAQLSVIDDITPPIDLSFFQRRNWAMAYAAFAHIAARDNLPALTTAQLKRAASQQPPARMELFTIAGKQVWLDGAHNAQKIKGLREALAERGATRAAVLANILSSPEAKVDGVLAELLPLAQHLIVPAFRLSQDLARRSLEPEEFAGRAQAMGCESVEIIRDVTTAIYALLARPEKVLVITGSLYLASQVRPILQKLS